MPRFFNTTGPCVPEDHYMLAPERRLPVIRRLIDQKQYFAIHAPRQVGKTTMVRALAEALTAEGRYAALLTTCGTVHEVGADDLEQGISAVIQTLQRDASLYLPAELQPPEENPKTVPAVRLRGLLIRWAQCSPRPLILFLDEIDILRDAMLVSVLRQIRSGHPERPRNFPQSVALISVRHIRDYRHQIDSDLQGSGVDSLLNFNAESLLLRNFTTEEVAELYGQHAAETGQVFTPDAVRLAWELTGGHPWLVNALARQAVEELAPDPATPITAAIIEKAKEVLIQRRDTHLDSLINRLRETRVRRVIEPLLAGERLTADVLNDDVQFVKDLGLAVSTPAGLSIANPIYKEVIPRALTSLIEESIQVPRPSYLGPDRRLLFTVLLDDFRAFWCQNAETLLPTSPYSEAAAQLVFMAFLQKIVNGGGFIDREYAVGRGRIDLCVRWPHSGGVERWAVELKVWRDGRSDPLEEGLEQLSGYLERLGLEEGTLVIFDLRSNAPSPLPERCFRSDIEHAGRRISVLQL